MIQANGDIRILLKGRDRAENRPKLLFEATSYGQTFLSGSGLGFPEDFHIYAPLIMIFCVLSSQLNPLNNFYYLQVLAAR
jgi:hypothetical protein